MVEFDCSFTLINGGLVDSTFAGLNMLEYAALDGNAYNSSVPSVLGSLPKLSALYIADAFISGDLSHMEGMPAIVEYWIDTNPGLTGTVPAFIGDISTLSSFSVTQNALVGALPTELGQLTGMVQMWYYGNNLSGQIPTEIGNLRKMKTFQVAGNSLTGIMPAEVCGLIGFGGSLEFLGADCGDPNFSVCNHFVYIFISDMSVRLT